jgi:hypothetical protein
MRRVAAHACPSASPDTSGGGSYENCCGSPAQAAEGNAAAQRALAEANQYTRKQQADADLYAQQLQANGDLYAAERRANADLYARQQEVWLLRVF